MKKKLFGITALFAAALITAAVLLLPEKSETRSNGEYIVAANEISHLISEGDISTAAEKTEALKLALSEENTVESENPAIPAMCAVCMLFLLGVSGYAYFAILRPFEKLTDFADRISVGDFDIPLDYERSNYFGKFTWAFDCMRREITNARACEKEAIENNKTVIASLSHDIKTPVASIRAYAEGLEAGLDSSPEKRRKYLSVIIKKCDEVAALTNDMFLHSISDLDKLRMNPEELELCGFIREIIPEISAHSSIKLSLPSYSVSVSADKNRLTQVFENITANAAKYAKTDTEISLKRTERNAEIIFRDYGGGIPDEELPFIFDKFYRGSRSGSENGAGLGLYIVKYIIIQSGGEIFAENLPDGFMIKIILPVCGS